ncbi:hydroxyacylglutathione hydrolase [Prochlorococcus marinus]|uniref:hydroxyacylglutathione hydrolase n=1 Tax=Prochlorococcus marinus TaxID=1219 RepID=UPI0022B5A706|nr:hydroxyacylglutathione hydrolase [Prochlorococcus marinus]
MERKYKDFIIHPIPVLKDNIIWIWVKGDKAVVVDPAISKPVIEWLNNRNLKLISVLQTHHHDDHIGGTQELLKTWPKSSVIAAKADIGRIPFQTQSVIDNETVHLLEQEIKVIEVPGHTRYHICYYLPGSLDLKINPVLFCGDTLFSGGCGRLFEGSALDMFNSLRKIKNLPEYTKIYCAHEYTKANLEWAVQIKPEDIFIKKRLKEVCKLRSKGLITLPTNLSIERKTNLFIRAKTSKELGELRSHKDNWKG